MEPTEQPPYYDFALVEVDGDIASGPGGAQQSRTKAIGLMKPGRAQNRISAREDTSLSLPRHKKPRPARGFLCLTGSSSLTGGGGGHKSLTVVRPAPSLRAVRSPVVSGVA